MNAASSPSPEPTDATRLPELHWPEEPGAIPDWVYTSQKVYDLEQELIFQGRTWSYVALEAQIPNPGDFTRSYVGSVPIIVARDKDGSLHAFENRCGHRGTEFCKEHRGNTVRFSCPYHKWQYDLRGNLVGVPFRRGVRNEGGMPESFKLEEHGPRKLHVTTRGGVVFASWRSDVEPLEQYLGPEILEDFDAMFGHRPLEVIGYYRNVIHANWKLYHENLRDPYHATLLHGYLVTFGLLVAGATKTAMIMDSSGRHGSLGVVRTKGAPVVGKQEKQEMAVFRENAKLNDPRVVAYVPELDSRWTGNMMTIWPNMVVQRQSNTFGIRHIVPQGPHQFLMIWTMFGYADDSEEMRQHRLRQGNLMGPSGFLGMEDNEALKQVQDGLRHTRPAAGVVQLEGDVEGTSTAVASEAGIRAMYRQYRATLGL